MVTSCCAFGCTNRFKKNGSGFFRFPIEPVRRKLWTLALRRKNFEPTNSSRICGEHFQTGRPSIDPKHPDYIPNIFIFKSSKKTYQSKSSMKPLEVRTENIVNVTCMPQAFNSGKLSSIKTTEHSEGENEMSVQAKKLQQDYTEVCHLMHQEDDLKPEDVSNIEELTNLQLELQQVYSTLHTVTQDRDQLLKKLFEAGLTQGITKKTLSAKEEELSKLKTELQQAYSELNVLRREKEELQKKLGAADVTESILQDPKKLHFYTGLSSPKDFRLILSLLPSVEENVRRISLETQALIVLMKLKLNLRYPDLAHRFQCSSSTIHRICLALIPILETKLDMLVKSPINSALRKNIPVGFKNTVYENLYQRVQKNVKLRTKQEEENEQNVIL